MYTPQGSYFDIFVTLCLFQDDQSKQQSVSAAAFPPRRRSDDSEDTKASTKIDARRLGRDTVVYDSSAGGSVELSTTRLRRRRRSMFVGVPSLTAEDDASWPTSSRRTPRTPGSNSVTAAPPADERRSSVSKRSRRFSSTSFARERIVPSSQSSPRISVTESCTSISSNTANTDASFVLQLQAKVKVSERPVRCLLNARYTR